LELTMTAKTTGHEAGDYRADRYVLPTTPAQVRTLRVMNGLVAWLTRRGLSVAGSRVLAVRGRTSGQWRTTPVNLMVVEGERYLLAPRGQTQWVRNLRAAGSGELRVGRRVEPFTATEVADTDKPALMREYLRRWAWEVGQFFDEIDKDSSDEQLLAAAPGFPAFRLSGTAA
jgi:deazaflavin-dependent oxidoreductase (nitroreductase family)